VRADGRSQLTRARRNKNQESHMTDVLTVIHECKDFAHWKKAYDADAPNRKAASLTDLALLQNVDDDNDLLLLWSIDDMPRAEKFLKSPALAEHQVKNAGVVGTPVPRFWTKA
jgi:hypothetical protein